MKKTSLLIVMALALLTAACETEVYRGLTQKDANEMMAVLNRSGIPAKRELTDGTNYRITVAEDKLAPAIEILKKAGYPREPFRSLGEVFPGDGLVVTPYEQRIRMMFALSQELGRTVTTINGVTNARVHIVVPDLDLRGLPLNKPSASVIAHHTPGIDTAELTGKIRMIVANGVQGLNYKDVSVALFPTAFGNEQPGSGTVSGGEETTAMRFNTRQASVQLAAPPAQKPGDMLPSLLWAAAILMGGAGIYLGLKGRGSSWPQ